MRLFITFLSASLAGITLFGCTPPPGGTTETPPVTESPLSPPTEIATLTVTPVPVEDPVLVGAGDIAHCASNGDELTANLLDTIPGTVFTTGDNAYPDGTASNFRDCYDPSWGRHKARTFPATGNHDYHVPGAADYFNYFGTVAGDPEKGYYSYNLGSWHIIVLNSNIPVNAGSPQEAWLRADLAAHPVDCTLAYWHHPRFSSGTVHGSNPKTQPFWQALYDFGADVILAGHEHNYERFALQDPQGAADPEHGIRQFVIGSGGRSHYSFGNPIANSEVRNGDTYGVLKLILHPGSYTWEFVPAAGGTFTDTGTSPCVSAVPAFSGQEFTFTPVDDATVKSEAPDENFGLERTLQADNEPIDNFLLKFDISGLNGRPVLAARLRLYNVNDSNAGGEVYRTADTTWSETTVTWNSAPGVEPNALAILGMVEKNTWYEVDLSSYVQGEGIYSFRITTNSANGADYASKEGDTGLHPQLILTLGE